MARWADRPEVIADEARRRRIALVGNARALTVTQQGTDIDAADIVVRLNRAPRPFSMSHGNRTDWLFTSIPLAPADLAALSPRRIFWASSRRKRLRYDLARDHRFGLTPAEVSARLIAELGARPSTGLIALAHLASLPAARITLHGFDFFASLSTSGRRQASEVPHDFDAERRLVERMLAGDPRLRLVDPVPTPLRAAPVTLPEPTPGPSYA